MRAAREACVKVQLALWQSRWSAWDLTIGNGNMGQSLATKSSHM